MIIKSQNIRKIGLFCLALSHLDRIVGRTRLQKILYLANLCDWNAIRDYVFYQYGPYSEWLSRELESLVQNEIIQEEREESLIDDRTLYTYRLTDAGRSFANNIINEIREPKLLSNTRRIFETLNKYTSDNLEIMASLVFLRRADPAKDDDTLVRSIEYYKPRFDEEKIRGNFEVFNLLEEFKTLC